MISTSNALSKRWFDIYILLKQLRFCPVYFHCPFVPIFFFAHLKLQPSRSLRKSEWAINVIEKKTHTKQIVDQSTNRVVYVVYMTRGGRNRSLGWFADQSLAIAAGKCRARGWISFGLIQAFYFAKTSKKRPSVSCQVLYCVSFFEFMGCVYGTLLRYNIRFTYHSTLCMPFEDNLFFYLTLAYFF